METSIEFITFVRLTAHFLQSNRFLISHHLTFNPNTSSVDSFLVPRQSSRTPQTPLITFNISERPSGFMSIYFNSTLKGWINKVCRGRRNFLRRRLRSSIAKLVMFSRKPLIKIKKISTRKKNYIKRFFFLNGSKTTGAWNFALGKAIVKGKPASFESISPSFFFFFFFLSSPNLSKQSLHPGQSFLEATHIIPSNPTFSQSAKRTHLN